VIRHTKNWTNSRPVDYLREAQAGEPSFCREFSLSDAPETRMNRGGDFSTVYKRDHFVECVGGRGGFAGKRRELHRDYFVRLPPRASHSIDTSWARARKCSSLKQRAEIYARSGVGSDLERAEPAARPGVLDDGLCLRTTRLGSKRPENQRH
jgi:hypothetical protein